MLPAQRFSLDVALLAAYASEACYFRRKGPSRGCRARIWKNIDAFEQGSVSGSVGELWEGTGLLAAFRGTERIPDWLCNLRYEHAASYTEGLVHSGYLDAVESIWPDLWAVIRDKRRKEQRILLTGHSMGGALAVLAASRLHRSRVPIGAVYTFGAPRVGDRAFVKSYRPIHYRFEYGNDIVPHLPPPPSISELLLELEYAHTGELKYLPRGQRIIQGSLAGSKRVLHELRRAVNTYIIPINGQYDDHWIGNYTRYLERLLDMECSECVDAVDVIMKGFTSDGRRRYFCTYCERYWRQSTG